ncbi:MAG TPA: protein kinase [Vicinamibacterales bacterium]
MLTNEMLGPYRVLQKLGEGGMGEVYRAKDTRLGRDVAVKVLSAHLSSDAGAKGRFEREAKAASSLNHPNICAVYDVGTQDDVHFLVMELVEGETLAARIERGPLQTSEILTIGTQIADALDKAHRKGLVHRDLKPANVILTKMGAKLLDFGLAKAVAAGADTPDVPATMLPTMTKAMVTQHGAIVGTVHYMAPEQLEGRDVDARADLWALGATLYEMATGVRAFEGTSTATLISSILRDEPRPVTELRPLAPAAFGRVVAQCLAKDRDDRWQSAGDLKRELTWLASGSGSQVPPAAAASAASVSPSTNPPAVSSRGRRALYALMGALIVALAATSVLLWQTTRTRDGEVLRFDVDALPDTALEIETRPALSISPDGRTIAFTAVRGGTARLYVRRRDETQARLLAGTEGASDPVFSPDSRWLAFVAAGELKKVSLDGPVISLAKVTDPRGAAWIDASTLVFSPHADNGLFKISASGGTPEPLTTLDQARGERTHRWPTVIPGGKAILFTVGTLASPDDYDLSPIDALVLGTGERKSVFTGASFARYAPTGHLLLARAASLSAVKFDPDRLVVSGETVPVVQGIATDTTTGATHFAVANNGTLIYLAGGTTTNDRRVFWAGTSGAPQPLANLPAAVYNDPKISPDGRKAALLVGPSGSGDVWVYDFERSTSTRLTFEGTDETPTWSADSRFVYFGSVTAPTKTTFYRKPADGSQDAERVAELPGVRAFLQQVSPRGDSLLFDYYDVARAGGQSEIARILVGTGRLEKIVATPANETSAVISPDGRWLAYVSDASGPNEIFVRDVSGGGRWQVSSAGGEEPRWSASGHELYFRRGTQLLAVSVEAGAQFHPGEPRVVVEGIYNLRSGSLMSYDVDPTRERFLMIRPANSSEISPMTSLRVVLNWFTDLRSKMK